jgi:hypothetical protein
MIRLWQIWPLLFAASVCFADDCTYDQSAQLELLQSIAKRHPGGILDIDAKTLTWSTASSTATSVTYGGCDHLGFKVTKNVSLTKTLTEDEVLDLASTLADVFWEPLEAQALSSAISAKAFNRETVATGIYYQIHNTYYYEFFIEHNQTEGYVAIGWARNF